MSGVRSGARYTLMREISGQALLSRMVKRRRVAVIVGKQIMRRCPMVVRPSESLTSSSLRSTHLPPAKASSLNFLTRCPSAMYSSARKRLNSTGFLKSIVSVAGVTLSSVAQYVSDLLSSTFFARYFLSPPLVLEAVTFALRARSVLKTSWTILLNAMPRRLSVGWMRPLGAMGKLSSRQELRPTDL